MAVGKEIRGKIKSVENTRKITKAMEMVAASKMRKAQDRMRTARPYSDRIAAITSSLSKANPEYRSPYMRDLVLARRQRNAAISLRHALMGERVPHPIELDAQDDLLVVMRGSGRGKLGEQRAQGTARGGVEFTQRERGPKPGASRGWPR